MPHIATYMRKSGVWRLFALEAARSMELYPDGSKLIGKDGKFDAEFCGPMFCSPLWEKKCCVPDHTTMLDREKLAHQIHLLLKQLPDSISV